MLRRESGLFMRPAIDAALLFLALARRVLTARIRRLSRLSAGVSLVNNSADKPNSQGDTHLTLVRPENTK